MKRLMLVFALLLFVGAVGEAEATGECWIDAPCCHAEVNCDPGRRCRCEADCDTIIVGGTEGCNCWCEDGDDDGGGPGVGPRLPGNNDDPTVKREKRKIIEAIVTVPRGGMPLTYVLNQLAHTSGWDIGWDTRANRIVPCGVIVGDVEYALTAIGRRLGLTVIIDPNGTAFVTDR